MKHYKLPLGLACLALFIPAPTLIFQFMKRLTESGSISIFNMNLSGHSAEFLLLTMSIVSISLFIISLRHLGSSFIQQSI